MDPEEIRAHIVERLNVMSESCNSHHCGHVAGVVRGLALALTGKDIGPPERVERVLEPCGIPFVRNGDGVDIPSEWLLAHGLTDKFKWIEKR